jgi:hypothetical protein
MITTLGIVQVQYRQLQVQYRQLITTLGKVIY